MSQKGLSPVPASTESTLASFERRISALETHALAIITGEGAKLESFAGRNAWWIIPTVAIVSFLVGHYGR